MSDKGFPYGTFGFPQDYTKAFELLHRAGDLGNAVSYCNIGYAYGQGEGVEKDEKKARYYFELSAIRGFELRTAQSRPFGNGSRKHGQSI